MCILAISSKYIYVIHYTVRKKCTLSQVFHQASSATYVI